MKNELALNYEKKGVITKTLFWMAIACICVTIVFMFPVEASTLFDKVEEVSKSIFSSIVKISTPLFGALIGISQIVFMVSGNAKIAEPAKEWRNRVIVAWIVINGIGFLVSTITPWLANGTSF